MSTRRAPPKRRLPRLSDSEWEIMLICWTLGSATAAQVHEVASTAKPRDYRTIATFLDRIARKGYLKVARRGGRNVYTPLVPFDRAVGDEVRRFLDETLAMKPEALRILEAEVANAIGAPAASKLTARL